MTQYKPKDMPSVPGQDKVIDSEPLELDDPNLYRQIVGSLIYVMSQVLDQIWSIWIHVQSYHS